MALGLGLLRLAPRDFWKMTPREMAHVMRYFAKGMDAAPPERAALDALMQYFPDQ